MNLFYANGTPIINSFKVQSELPLDPRLYVQDLIERDSLVTNHISHDGMRVWVKTTNKIYQYDKDHNTWTEIGEFTADDVEKLNNITDYLIDTEHVYGVDNKLIFRERVYNPADDTTDIRDYIIDEAKVENGELYNGLISKFFINRLNNVTNYITKSKFTTKQDDSSLYHTITHYNPDDDVETIEDINIPTATDVNNGLLSNIQNIKLNRIEDYVNDIDLTHTNLDSVGLQYSYKVYNPNTDQTTNYDIVIPLVKDTENGLMSNIQHIKLGRIINYMTEFGTYNNNASGLNYVYKTYNPNTDVTEDHNVLIPLSQHNLNGLLSSVDKIKLDDIVRIVTDIYLYTSFTDTEAIGLQYSVTNPNTQTDTTVEIEIPLVTDTKNGLVSPARKHWMDNADGLSNTGTTSDTWQLGKKDIDTKLDTAGGVIIKDVNGDLAVRNASDSDYEDILVKNITASGNTNISGDINVGGDADITGNTSITGNTDITGTLTVDNTTTLNGATTVNNNLTVTGTSNLQGNVDIDSNLNVDGITNLVGDVTLQNNLTVDKNITSDSVYTDTLKVNTIISDGDITINKEINTNGIVNNGNITNTGAINNTGNVNITGNLTVSDDITSDTITTGTITVDQIVSTGTDIVFDKSINTVGINNTGALNNTGDVTITGDVDVTGAINATGNIETPLDITARNITATNNLTAQGDTTLQDTTVNNLVIRGNVTQQGQSFITEAETVEVKDNMLTLNNGETGAGVTAGQAGIEIDRGTSNPFFFVFNEDSDRFEVGTEGDLQPVMLRDTEANLTDTNILVWDAANKRAVTSSVNVGNLTQLNLATNGSGNGYLVTKATGNTITGRALQVSDINGFTSPWFRISTWIYANAGTSAWNRWFGAKDTADASEMGIFGVFGSQASVNYAYIASGTNDYYSVEILKVYPTNITFGNKSLAVWGSASSYDTYLLYRRYLTINGYQYSMVGTDSSDTATIFAPTTAGSSGQILQSDGTNIPKWVAKSVTISQISNLNSGWDTLLAAAPSTYVTRWPQVSEVTGLQDALDDKADSTDLSSYMPKSGGRFTGPISFQSSSLSSKASLTSFLGVDTFASGGRVYYISANDLRTQIGAASTSQLNGYLPLSGGTLTGAVTFNDSISFTNGSIGEDTTPEYFLTMHAFADGGDVLWSRAADVRTAIGAASTSHTHNYIVGEYNGSGGVIAPSAVGTNKLWCKMMYDNPPANGGGYCDWILMNAYNWSDVPYATAIGVSKKATPAAYIMSGPNSSDKSTWVRKQLATTDLLTWDNITGKPSTFTPSSHTHTIAQISDLNSGWDTYLQTSPIITKTEGIYPTINNAGNEICIGSNSDVLHVNHSVGGGTSPKNWYWRAGSSTSYANGYWGNLYMSGKLVATQSWVTEQKYLTSISSSNVTGALGYTPARVGSLGTISLNGNMNTLPSGLWYQTQNANATAGKGYPYIEAGGLIVLGGPYNGTNQIYLTYDTNRLFFRASGTSSSGTSHTDWKEVADRDWVLDQISGSGGGTITSVSGSGASPLTLDISTSSSGAVTILGAISDASAGNAGVVTIKDQTFAGNKTFNGQIISSTIVPRSNNSYNIGTSSNKYANVYATTFTGNLVGNASSATTANSATTAGTANSATTASTASKLSTSSAGSAINPVYFADGIPKAGTYSFWTGTAAQYEALSSKSNTTIYFVTD